MAAAGCGPATAAAAGGGGGGPGGGGGAAAAARGRFPGRPRYSRSRVHSDKRWQLGRSGAAEAEEARSPGGGHRPAEPPLQEDPSARRLLGIQADHRRLGQAGYSSSGSGEVSAQPRPGVSIFILHFIRAADECVSGDMRNININNNNLNIIIIR